MAGELSFGCFGDRLVELHVIIIKEFLAGLDVARCVNEDAVVFLHRFAVWIAGMIDPAGVVTADFWIYYVAVFQAKVESVWIVGVVRRGFPGNAFACVFDNACAFWNELRGVDAPAVHSGLPNLDLHGSLSSSCFLRHTRARNYLLAPVASVSPIPLWRR